MMAEAHSRGTIVAAKVRLVILVDYWKRMAGLGSIKVTVKASSSRS